MKLLIDASLSPRLGVGLRGHGHDVVHVTDLGLASASDAHVLSVGRDQQRVIVTADVDFGTILARAGLDSPSVVLVRRTAGRRADQLLELLTNDLAAVEGALTAGCIAVIGEGSVTRIRRLPIR